MLPLLALALLQQDQSITKDTMTAGPQGPGTILLKARTERLPRPKLSPKSFGEPPQPWEFDWLIAGYARINGEFRLRFELFSQESTVSNDRAERVLRLFTRLHGYSLTNLRLDHAESVSLGAVSVYLCYGGKPGGEQLFDFDRQVLPGRKVNSIYLYDLRSFTDPVEMVREVAHEYGHAILPPVGGFTEPENWSNGYLGERVFIPMLAQSMQKGEVTSSDVFGATKEGLNAWVKANVDPHIAQAAINGPQPTLLAGKSKESMDAYLGLVGWTQRLYSDRTMIRALLANGIEAKDIPSSIADAVETPGLTTLKIPEEYRGKAIWVPVGRCQVIGAKSVSKPVDGWVKIVVGTAPIVVSGLKIKD